MSKLLVILALFVAACGSEPTEKSDAGTPDGGVDMAPEALAGELAIASGSDILTLQEGDDIEIISGFQGGWHLEPYLRLSGVESDDLNGTVTFWVEQDGTRIAESGVQGFEPIFFQPEGDNFLFYTQPIIFLGENTPDVLAGTQATIRVDFMLDDGRSLDLTTNVTLVNENEEFEF